MALTAPTVWRVQASFVDRDKNKSGFSFMLPAALAVAAADAAALVVINAAAALSNAALVGYTLTYQITDPAVVVGDIPEEADVERKGVFSWPTANGFRTKIELPSIDNTFVIDGTNKINTSDAAVLAFIAAMGNTGLGAGNSPITARGEDILGQQATAPYKMHRGSTKG